MSSLAFGDGMRSIEVERRVDGVYLVVEDLWADSYGRVILAWDELEATVEFLREELENLGVEEADEA